MKRVLLLCVVINLCVSTVELYAAFGDFRPVSQEELAMKASPVAPGSPAVVLEWSEFQDDVQSLASYYFRIKILTDDGKKYANVEVPYMRGFSNVTAIKGRTIRPDGTIATFKEKVYDKLIVKSGRHRVMAKTFSLPEVQPGSIIEYRYNIEWDRNRLVGTRWLLQQELPVLKASLRLKPYSSTDFSTFFIHVGLPAGKLPVKKGSEWLLELENLPPFDKEPFSPPEEQTKPRVEFFYVMGAVSGTEQFWNREVAETTKSVESFMNERKAMAKAASEILAGATTPEDRLRQLYERVQAITNLSYLPQKTAQEEKRSFRENKNVADVLANGYGYRTDLTRLFVALARAAGFDADVIRVAQRDEVFFVKELLDANQLNGEIAVVTVDGKEQYLDPGTPLNPFGLVSWENSGVAGVRVDKKAGARWIETPDQHKEKAVTRRRADLQLEDDVLKGTATVTYEGQDALQWRLFAFGEDEAAQKKILEEEAKEWFDSGATVSLKKVTGLDSPSEPLRVEYDVQIPNVVSAAGSRVLLPMSLFESQAKNPFSAQKRVHPIYFQYEHQIEDEVNVTLPSSLRVETLPAPASHDLKALTYKTTWSSSGQTVRFGRSFAVNAMLLAPQYYPSVRGFYGKVQAGDEATAVLRSTATQ